MFALLRQRVLSLPPTPDVPAGAAASHAAPLPPAPDQTGGGRPPAALLPPLDPALLQARVPRHRGSAHVGGLLGALSGQGKVRAASFFFFFAYTSLCEQFCINEPTEAFGCFTTAPHFWMNLQRLCRNVLTLSPMKRVHVIPSNPVTTVYCNPPKIPFKCHITSWLWRGSMV